MQNATSHTEDITIINDGQVKYPVYTQEMMNWEKENGEITASNYQDFCDSVEIAGIADGAMVGTREMIDLCNALVGAGAATRNW